MNIGEWMVRSGLLWSPTLFAALVALAVGLLWLAFTPAPGRRPQVDQRLSSYVDRTDPLEDEEMQRPFAVRVLWPLLRGLLRAIGSLAPQRHAEKTRQLLLQAGEPGRLSVLDFWGVRLLSLLFVGGGYLFLFGRDLPLLILLRNGAVAAAVGYYGPYLWLRSKARRRQHQIIRALPDALDMLTIGVEAGLAFESALMRVGEKWDNPLTQEFRRAVSEMRVGVARDVALQRIVERTGVSDLGTFVAVLVQSSQLGVSIAEVLHSQAWQMRVKRRQRAEELARQASVKMVFPLVFLIFPAMFVVILGPSIPAFMEFSGGMTGGG